MKGEIAKCDKRKRIGRKNTYKERKAKSIREGTKYLETTLK